MKKQKRRHFLQQMGAAALGTMGLSRSSHGKIKQQKNPKIVWNIQTYAGEDLAQQVIKRSINKFNEIAAGEMRIDLHYADKLIPTEDVFRALKEGDLDLAQADDASIGSTADISVFSGYFPFACRSSLDVPVLFNKWGLKRIWLEAYRNVEGVTWLGSGSWDPCHFITVKELNGLDDLQGLKVTTFPTAGKFLSRFGVQPVQIKQDAFIPALNSGDIDGMAWSGITEGYEVGWYLHANYFLTNSISGAWIGSYFANSKKWDALPGHLKQLFLLCMDSSHYHRLQWYWGDEAALRVQGKAGKKKKLKLSTIPPNEWEIVQLESHSFWNEIAKISPRTKEVIDILRAYKELMLKAGAPYG